MVYGSDHRHGHRKRLPEIMPRSTGRQMPSVTLASNTVLWEPILTRTWTHYDAVRISSGPNKKSYHDRMRRDFPANAAREEFDHTCDSRWRYHVPEWSQLIAKSWLGEVVPESQSVMLEPKRLYTWAWSTCWKDAIHDWARDFHSSYECQQYHVTLRKVSVLDQCSNFSSFVQRTRTSELKKLSQSFETFLQDTWRKLPAEYENEVNVWIRRYQDIF